MKVNAIERVGQKVKIINQSKLPSELEYQTLDDYEDIIGAIKRMEIRGAPAIGIAAAYGIAIAASNSRESDIASVKKVAEEFKATRPTAVNLTWAADRMVKRLMKDSPDSPDKALSLLWSEAEAIHQEDRQMCQEIGLKGAEFINEGDSILTHCNTGALATGGIGTALGIVYTCHQQEKRIHVYVDETRPVLQGARLTAWELLQEGIPVTLICDSVAGTLFQQGKVRHVIVGADRITKNRDVANKIGTYPLAVLAARHNVPFYVAAPTSTFDDSIDSGSQIAIEERSADEITRGLGVITAPDGVEVYAPAFDITPRELVSYYISNKKVEQGGRK